MNVKDLIEIIPNLFLYFIPGYIAITIKNYYKSQKKSNDNHIIIMSLVISFIIKSLSDGFLYLFNCIFKLNIILTKFNEPIVLISCSIIFGVAWYKYYGSFIDKFIRQKLESNIESEPNVWNYAMKSVNGSWVTVHLYNVNKVYQGKLIAYTIDPDEKNREVLLCSYARYNLETGDLIESFNDDKKCVLINCNDLVDIEIHK
ncbi:hypothetical protein ACSXDI_13865 [Clostridium perfringens]|uniref:hypothetical protein n=2 Tax=Clostridium perfringens TaxID=1502 RepID=UPI00374E6917